MDKIGVAGQLMAYESGELEEPEVIALFQFLLDLQMKSTVHHVLVAKEDILQKKVLSLQLLFDLQFQNAE